MKLVPVIILYTRSGERIKNLEKVLLELFACQSDDCADDVTVQAITFLLLATLTVVGPIHM